ncbi:MAG: DNA-processing protein DprA [Bacteroidetes bacterium]|nr:DNA-processing protein DprA [Bacteroidota bacterium]
MNTLYNIALTLIPKIGDVLAKNLVAYCGSSEAVFKEKKDALLKIPGIGQSAAKSIVENDVLIRAEQELEFIMKYGITPLFYLDKDYPNRLKQCNDGPVMLYYKGENVLNSDKIISIIGTRNATNYGKQQCEKLVADLKELNPVIISGLAYGIDVHAHQAALDNELPTIAVLAHGLDKMYPAVHKSVAKKMIENGGGLLTDFKSETIANKENFPKRNRIVAGICDAVVVVESKKEGGSLITANIAVSYSRDVFAFPGKATDVYSQGCNHLIKTNRAGLIESAEDLIYQLGWQKKEKKPPTKQIPLFANLSPEEEVLVKILQEKGNTGIDDLAYYSSIPVYKLSTLLLNLEFAGVVRSLPGKMYSI